MAKPWVGTQNWQEYPVFYIDFNKKNYKEDSALETVLDEHLRTWEEIYGDQKFDRSLEERFRYVIERAVEKTGTETEEIREKYG